MSVPDAKRRKELEAENASQQLPRALEDVDSAQAARGSHQGSTELPGLDAFDGLGQGRREL